MFIIEVTIYFFFRFVKKNTMYTSWLKWRLGDSLGISNRGTRVKRLIGRP